MMNGKDHHKLVSPDLDQLIVKSIKKDVMTILKPLPRNTGSNKVKLVKTDSMLKNTGHMVATVSFSVIDP